MSSMSAVTCGLIHTLSIGLNGDMREHGTDGQDIGILLVRKRSHQLPPLYWSKPGKLLDGCYVTLQKTITKYYFSYFQERKCSYKIPTTAIE